MTAGDGRRHSNSSASDDDESETGSLYDDSAFHLARGGGGGHPLTRALLPTLSPLLTQVWGVVLAPALGVPDRVGAAAGAIAIARLDAALQQHAAGNPAASSLANTLEGVLELLQRARGAAADPSCAVAVLAGSGLALGAQLRASQRSRELARDALYSMGLFASSSAAAAACGALVLHHRNGTALITAATSNTSTSDSEDGASSRHSPWPRLAHAFGVGRSTGAERSPAASSEGGGGGTGIRGGGTAGDERSRERTEEEARQNCGSGHASPSFTAEGQWRQLVVAQLWRGQRGGAKSSSSSRLRACLRVFALALLFAAVGRTLGRVRSSVVPRLVAVLKQFIFRVQQHKQGRTPALLSLLGASLLGGSGGRTPQPFSTTRGRQGKWHFDYLPDMKLPR